MAGPNWERLARYVNERMPAVDIRDQAELIRATTLSAPSAKALMDGKPRSPTVRPKTLRLLDDGLLWAPGSSAAILAGGEPTVVEASAGGEVSSPDDQRVERLEGRFDELLEILDEVLASDLSTMGQAWAERRQRVEGPSAAGAPGSSP